MKNIFTLTLNQSVVVLILYLHKKKVPHYDIDEWLAVCSKISPLTYKILNLK